MARLGLGTWRRFDLPPSEEHRARVVVEEALRIGVRLFDTAPVYGRAEGVLARALGKHRHEAFVATKIWADDPAGAQRQLNTQLKLFDDHVDLLQIHHLIGWRRHLDWMRRERSRGRLGMIGVSFWRDGAFGGGTVADLEQAMLSGDVDAVQVPLNPRERAVEQRILPLARDRGIGVIAMRPFGEGGLLPAVDPARLAETGCAQAAEALLRWTLSDDRVDIVIPATLSITHLTENATAAAKPPLDPDTRQAVAKLLA
jgi:diketogulonate reductase-like aldo/keto reductase